MGGNSSRERLAELSQRAGNYTLLFLSFAVVTAATLLQIPTDHRIADYLIAPNHHMVTAMKVWMLSAIPLILAILPMSEIINEKHLPKVTAVKFITNWIGMLVCIVGIIYFVLGIS